MATKKPAADLDFGTGDRAATAADLDFGQDDAPAAKASLPSGVTPSTAGGGRGRVNPTLPVEEAPPGDPMGTDLVSAIANSGTPSRASRSLLDRAPEGYDSRLKPDEVQRLASEERRSTWEGNQAANRAAAVGQPRRSDAGPARDTPKRSAVRAAGDVALGVYQGAAGMLEGAARMSPLPGSELVADFLDTASKGAGRLKSPDLQEQEVLRQARVERVGKSQGEMAAARAAFQTVFDYPAAGIDLAAQGAGSLLPTLALGSAGVSPKAIEVLNALSTAGDAKKQTEDKLRKIAPEAWQKDASYQALRGLGMDHQQALDVVAPIYSLPAQAAGAIAGAISGKLGVEETFANRAAGAARRDAFGDRVARVGAEHLGEQGETWLPGLAQNAVVGGVDGQTGLLEGMGQQAADTFTGTLAPGALAARSQAHGPGALAADAAPQAPAQAPATPGGPNLASAAAVSPAAAALPPIEPPPKPPKVFARAAARVGADTAPVPLNKTAEERQDVASRIQEIEQRADDEAAMDAALATDAPAGEQPLDFIPEGDLKARPEDIEKHKDREARTPTPIEPEGAPDAPATPSPAPSAAPAPAAQAPAPAAAGSGAPSADALDAKRGRAEGGRRADARAPDGQPDATKPPMAAEPVGKAADVGSQPLLSAEEGAARAADRDRPAAAPASSTAAAGDDAGPGGQGVRADGRADEGSRSAPGDGAGADRAAEARHPDLKTAQDYIRDQKARGSSIVAAPYTHEDGTVSVAVKGTPNYQAALDQRQARIKREADAKAGIEPDDILNAQGKPFTTRIGAKRAMADRADTHDIVRLDAGAFVVRKKAAAPAAPAQAAINSGAEDGGNGSDVRPVAATAARSGSDNARGGVGAELGVPGAPGETVLPRAPAGASEQGGPVPPVERGDGALIEHTTSKGKTLRGVVRQDLDAAGAKAIDPYAFRKDGGWFIREKHLAAAPDSMNQVSRETSAAATPAARVDAAAHQAATSEQNDTPAPTDAQKAAGNYQMGHLSGADVQGLNITIENPKGSKRTGTSPDGTAWSNTMGAHYGYVKGSEAADGDHVDVFVGPAADRAPRVWVIDQVNADGTYDEAKALFGFMSKAAAVRAYKASYSKGWKVGPITEMSVDEFKAGLADGRFMKPLDSTLAQAPGLAKVGDALKAMNDADQAVADFRKANPQWMARDKLKTTAPDDVRKAYGEPIAKADAAQRAYTAASDARSPTKGDADALYAGDAKNSSLQQIANSAETPAAPAQDATKTVATLETPEAQAKQPLEVPEAAFAKALKEAATSEDGDPYFTPPETTVRSEDAAKAAGETLTPEQAAARLAEWKAHAKAQGEAGVNSGRVVLSLFDTTGHWSQPWRDAGYEVHQFDIQDGMDINEFSAQYLTETLGIESADVILAAPPCTDFSSSGAHAWKAKDADGRTAASVQLVRQTLATVELFRPSVWSLENPVGRIGKLTGLPKPTLNFQPNNYGDPYTKRTLLWGSFEPGLPLANIEATEGSKIARMSGQDKFGRSVTPEGFAYAFFMANNLADQPAARRLANEFKGVPEAALAKAIEAGHDEAAVKSAIEDDFHDHNLDGVAETLAKMAEPKAPTPAPAAPAAAAEPKPKKPKAEPKPKRESKADREAREAEEARAKHFTPGNIVRSYAGFDEVLSYKPGPDWSVTVAEVRKDGDNWVRVGKPQDARTHTTQPDARALRQGPIARLTEKSPVTYTEPRADGQAFPDAPARGAAPSSAPAAAPAAQVTASKGAAAAPASKKIEDFGETLSGAKKMLYTESVNQAMEKAAALDVAAEPLSKSWPEPDYRKLLESGADPWAVSMVRAMRDLVPTKPQKAWRLKPWVEQVKMLRGFAADILTKPDQADRLRTDLAKINTTGFISMARHLEAMAEVYRRTDHAVSLKGIEIGSANYTMLDGTYFPDGKVLWSADKKAAASAFSNWPRQIVRAETRQAVIDGLVDKIKAGAMTEEKAKRSATFDIYSDRRANLEAPVFIGKKVGKEVIRLKTGFKTGREAREWRDANQDALEKALADFKYIPPVRNAENAPRVGEDHRHGADVTPEQFAEAFGFRGVQFGNYVEAKRRQADLNRAYDALMDLAAVIDVPARALSLDGKLGLAFGARGSGGKEAPAAHYEPGQVVINLTKKEGAGTLAHEWWHALDNYFAKRDDKTGYMSATPDGRGDVRPEVREAFRRVKRTLAGLDLVQRSKVLDKRKSNPYWSTAEELSARSFESYVIAKLHDQNSSNDYLANVVPELSWVLGDEPSFPYPLAEELPKVREAFDGFFSTIEHRQTDRGTTELFSHRDADAAPTDKGFMTAPASQQHDDLVAKVRASLAKSYPNVKGFKAVDVVGGSAADPQAAQTMQALRTVGRRLFGKEVVLVKFDDPGSAAFNALYSSSPGLDGKAVFINVDGNKPYLALLGHELLHALRADQPAIFNELTTRLLPATKNLAGYYDWLTQAYADTSTNVDNIFEEEFVADIVGQHFTDPQFWRDLVPENRGLARRIADAIVKFLDGVIQKLTRTNSLNMDQFIDDAKAVRAAVVGAMRAYSASQAKAGGMVQPGTGEMLAKAAPAPAPQQPKPSLARAIFGGSMAWTRDQSGKPVKLAEQKKAYEKIGTDERAEMLLRAGAVTEAQLKRWRESKLNVYEGAVNNRFRERFESPGVVWTDEELRRLFKLDDAAIADYRNLRAAADTSIARQAVGDMIRAAGKEGAAVFDEVQGLPMEMAAERLRDHLLEASEAHRIPEAAPTVTMTDAERNEAIARAEDLERQAETLRAESANTPPTKAMRDIQAKIDALSQEAAEAGPGKGDELMKKVKTLEGDLDTATRKSRGPSYAQAGALADEAKALRKKVADSIAKPGRMGGEGNALITKANAVIDILDAAQHRMDHGHVPSDVAAEVIDRPWQAPGASKIDKLIYEWQDGKVDLKRVQEAIERDTGDKIEDQFDARLAETNYAGRVAKRSHDFNHDEVKPLLEAMQKDGIDQVELGDYLHARAAPERNKQIAKVNDLMPDGGAGKNSKGLLLTTAAANKYIADIPADRRAKLERLGAMVDRITAGTRSLLVDYGLEDAETIAAWEKAYKHYVPMFRQDVEFNRLTIHKRAMGSESEAVNIVAQVIQQREAALVRGEKNRIAVALYGLALSNPNPEFWATIRPDSQVEDIRADLERMGIDPALAEAGMQGVPEVTDIDPVTNKVTKRLNPFYRQLPGAITLKIKGESRVLLLNVEDERAARMAAAMKGQDSLLNDYDIAGSLVGRATRWLAAVNTQYNPAFGLVNFWRDSMGGIVHLTNTPLRYEKVRVMAGLPGAIRGIFHHLTGREDKGKWSRLFEQFMDDGGQTGFTQMFENGEKRAADIERQLARMSQSKADPRRVARMLLGLLSGFNEIMENAVRLSAYAVAIDKGMTRPQAARLGRELTVDFNRKGRTGRTVGPLYAFFNAALQGTERTLRALRGPAGARIITGGFALGILQGLMLAAAGYDDEDLPDFVKARAFIIPLPGEGKKYIAIPLPLGLHVLPNTGRVVTEMALGDLKPKKLGAQAFNAVGEIAGAFNPLGGGNVFTADGALKTALPTVLDPLVELAANKNFAGRPIEQEERGERDARPGFARTREGTRRQATGQAYIGISKAVNWMTGGSDVEQGAVSWTPERYRYIAQVLGGGVLREFERTVNLSAAKAAGQEVPENSIPVLNRWYGKVDDQQTQRTKYFGNVNRLEKREAEIRAARKADLPEVLDRLQETPEASAIRFGNRAQQAVAKLTKEVKTTTDPERLKELDAERYQWHKDLNESIEQEEKSRRGQTLGERVRAAWVGR